MSIVLFETNGGAIFRILLTFLAPIVYIINPYFLLIIIIAQLISYAQCKVNNLSERFLILFIHANLYAGISIFSLKIYDILIFTFFLYLFIQKKGHIRIKLNQIFLLFIVFFVFIIHFQVYSFVAVLRYLFSIMLMVLILDENINLNQYKNIFIELILSNLYYAVILFILIKNNLIENHTSFILQTSIYLFSSEVRINGFFTDPNKYMCFCFTLLLIIEIFWEKGKEKVIASIILLVSAVISGSRTALIVVMFYLVSKYLFFLFKKNTGLFITNIIVIIIIPIIAFGFQDKFNTFLNSAFVLATRLTGRTHTLSVNATLQDDNRMRIWKLSLGFIKTHLWFGNGWLSYKELLPYPSHNTFISLLLDGGVVMIITYIYFFWRAFFNRYWYLTLPLFFIPVFFFDMSDYRIYFMLLAMLWKLDKSCDINTNSKIRGGFGQPMS